MAKKVLITANIAEEGKLYLTERGYELKNAEGAVVRDISAIIEDCDAVLVRTEKITAEALEKAKKLKVIGKHGIGVDNIDVEAASRLGIQVVNAPESNICSVAEHALMLILAISKHLVESDKAVRSGSFGLREYLNTRELRHKTLGVVGFGRIGRKVAASASAGLGMKILVHDPYVVPEEVEKAHGYRYSHILEDLFAESDIITVHIPHNGATDGVINKKHFSLMKPSGLFVNTSRGKVVNEADLIEALDKNLIAGAALDVFEQEPVRPENPLLKFRQVILTPHNAALTDQAKIDMALHAAQGIHEVLSGKVPTWPVNTV